MKKSYLIDVKESWINIFNNFNNNTNTLDNIVESINKNKETIVYPKVESIFECFKYFEINATKVVILGQDPYHGPNQATGLCFGVNNNNVPPSLRNIIKELKFDLNIDLTDLTLKNWAKQGILLLNASLSVVESKPNSHSSLWNKFTQFIIDELNKCDHKIIFVAWGAFAHNKFKNINIDKHSLVVSSHPSPLSVYKNYKSYPCFNNSKPFSQINQLLKSQNSGLIDW